MKMLKGKICCGNRIRRTNDTSLISRHAITSHSIVKLEIASCPRKKWESYFWLSKNAELQWKKRNLKNAQNPLQVSPSKFPPVVEHPETTESHQALDASSPLCYPKQHAKVNSHHQPKNRFCINLLFPFTRKQHAKKNGGITERKPTVHKLIWSFTGNTVLPASLPL